MPPRQLRLPFYRNAGGAAEKPAPLGVMSRGKPAVDGIAGHPRGAADIAGYGELTTADRAQNCLHRDLGVLRRVRRRHQRTSRQMRLQRGDPRLQGVEIGSQRPQRALCKSMAGSREQARPSRVADLAHHHSRPDGPLPPNGVLAAGQPLDLPATLPGYLHQRHASLLLQFPRRLPLVCRSATSSRSSARRLVVLRDVRGLGVSGSAGRRARADLSEGPGADRLPNPPRRHWRLAASSSWPLTVDPGGRDRERPLTVDPGGRDRAASSLARVTCPADPDARAAT